MVTRPSCSSRHPVRALCKTSRQVEQKGEGVNNGQLAFLRALLKWDGVAPPRALGQTTQAENSARQSCKRRGWVTFDGYWRITEDGRKAVKERETVEKEI